MWIFTVPYIVAGMLIAWDLTFIAERRPRCWYEFMALLSAACIGGYIERWDAKRRRQ